MLDINKQRMTTSPAQLFLLFFLIIQVIILSACANWLGFPTYYDPTTYKNLTDLKPRIMMLYESFTEENVRPETVNDIRLKLAQIYEYEKGKGEQNRETVIQMEIIQRILDRHVKDWQENKPWSASHMENQKQTIGEAFDIAIQTENLKNKNR